MVMALSRSCAARGFVRIHPRAVVGIQNSSCREPQHGHDVEPDPGARELDPDALLEGRALLRL
jgi:hypothetical protein